MKKENSKTFILDDTSPRIKRCHSGAVKYTTASATSGVPSKYEPRIILKDIMDTSYVQSSDSSLYYKQSDNFVYIRPCKVLLKDVFDYDNNLQYCSVTKCGKKQCKTCDILITDTSFQSNLTKKTYTIHSYEDLDCTSSNIIYGIECTLCGLIYVDETHRKLHLRMNGHRSGIDNKSDQFLYSYFKQPDHSIVSMK